MNFNSHGTYILVVQRHQTSIISGCVKCYEEKQSRGRRQKLMRVGEGSSKQDGQARLWRVHLSRYVSMVGA